MKRISLIIYGLFPTNFSTCAPCCPSDYFYDCGEAPDEWMNEYPRYILENQNAVTILLSNLSLYLPYLDIKLVGADSLRGVIYAARYKLKTSLSVIINNKVFRDPINQLSEIKDYISQVITKELGVKISK